MDGLKKKPSFWDFGNVGHQWDLSKRFPGYFNKWVFRCAVILVAIFYFGLVLPENDWSFRHEFVKCPMDAEGGFCYHPKCIHNAPDDFLGVREPIYDNSPGCTIPAGQEISTKGPYAKAFVPFAWSMLILPFIINHSIYAVNSRRKHEKN